MPRIEKISDFTNTLSALPLPEQHHLSKKFISGVMHLAENSRLVPLIELLSRPSCSEDDLHTARAIAKSVYVETSPGSDISEMKMNCQSTNFIAHAVLVCSAPVSPGTSPIHVAHKVANYCRMAQLCLSMGHSEEGPDFSKAEAEYNKILKEQIAVLEEFLSGQGA
jgi:hypothetical protein